MITDRLVYAKPAFPSSWPVNTVRVDPVFGQRVLRVTDGNVLSGAIGASFGGPSAGYQFEWSADGTKFYVIGSAGGIVPYTFDPIAMSRARISGSGDGGLQPLSAACEPQFSYVNDNILYVTGENSTHHTPTIRKFDFNSQNYTQLIDMWPLLNGLGKTIVDDSYCVNIFSSEASPERIVCMCPNQNGDESYIVIVFEVGNPSNMLILDTMASTVSINGAAFTSIGTTLGIHLHGVDISKNGRFVCLFTATSDFVGHEKKYIWDTQTGSFTALLPYPGAHTCMGWDTFINQDFDPVPGLYDNAQWSVRQMDDISHPHNLIKNPQAQGETYCDGHTSWHNAKAGSLEPIIGEIYRAQDGPLDSPHNDALFRAWDDEIIRIQTNGLGTTTLVERACHHHSIVRDDNDLTNGITFYYQPRSNVSRDGKFCLFTSNGERNLGTNPAASAPMIYRYDVFMVELGSPVIHKTMW